MLHLAHTINSSTFVQVKLLKCCKEHEAALASAQAGLKRWPRSVDAWLLLLELLLARGPGAEDVLRAFEEALSAIPKQVNH